MSKTIISGRPHRKDANGNKISKKSLSHGTYRCTRHPTSKRCNGS
jgi:hypothetical protein